MKHHLNGYLSPPRPAAAASRIPRRWRWFIALSTAFFLSVAGVIALWFPEYVAVAWALLLFSACHVTFLLVQRVGCEPAMHPADRPDGAGQRDGPLQLP